MGADTYPKAGEKQGTSLEELDKLFKEAADARRPYEGQWYLNISFWRGRQWVMWDGTQLAALDEDEPLPVDNRIKPIVRKAIAKETKQRPIPEATPEGTDDDDIEGGLLAEELVEHWWDKFKLSKVTRSQRWWRRLTGIGFVKVTWDRTKGDYVEVLVDDQGNVEYDESGRPLTVDRADVQKAIADAALAGRMPKTKRVAMGEISVKACPTFGVYVDPHAGEEGLETARWLFEEWIEPIEDLRDRYPDKAHLIDADTHASVGPGQLPLPGLGRRREGPKTGAKIREFWERPCPRYPDGRRVLHLQKLILEDDKNPYGWLPYTEMRGDPDGGTFYPGAFVTDLIWGQIRINKRAAQIGDNADRFGNPALMYPQGMDLDYDGTVGEHLQYPATGMPDARPEYLSPVELPAYIIEELQAAVGSMQEISGQHEVSSAQVPAGVTAASAISMLLEQDDTQLGPDIEDSDMGLEDLANRMLELAGEYYTDERTIAIAGEDGDWEVRRFQGNQLAGAGRRYRVRFRTGTPQSKAAKQAAMTTLMDLMFKYGGPQSMNPRNLRRFLRDFEVGGLERMFADVDVVERKVARENRRMLRGEEVEVHQWDRHADEIEAHNEERMSIRFERAVARDPQVTQRFEAHIEAHALALKAQMDAMPPPPPPPGNGGSQETANPASP